MPDLQIKESCPCGSTIELGGYSQHVNAQIAEWRRIHKPHMKPAPVPAAGETITRWPEPRRPWWSPYHDQWWFESVFGPYGPPGATKQATSTNVEPGSNE